MAVARQVGTEHHLCFMLCGTLWHNISVSYLVQGREQKDPVQHTKCAKKHLGEERQMPHCKVAMMSDPKCTGLYSGDLGPLKYLL